MKPQLFIIVLAATMFLACTPEPEIPQKEWPLPLNRTGYLVEKLVVTGNASHSEATYEYDENNRLICRRFMNGVTDSIFYTNGNVTRIRYSGAHDLLFFYNENNQLIRAERLNYIMCFWYHNGWMDSITFPNHSGRYFLLEYDNAGNIVRETRHLSKQTMVGTETGEFRDVTFEFEYDDAPRPNFNMDNVFAYEPLFGRGGDFGLYYAYLTNLSQNNMVYSGYWDMRWEYEYNEQGLPVSIYDVQDEVTCYITYRPIQ